MTETEIKELIQQQLPALLGKDPQIRDFILRRVSEYYSPRQETDSKFDRVLAELKSDREEQARKWEEQNNYNKAILEEINRHSALLNISLYFLTSSKVFSRKTLILELYIKRNF